ncbi:MAG: DUF5675 family protein [Thermoanaerobaculia bacterium]
MELELARFDCNGRRTFGRLYVDGSRRCYTLEDPVRVDDPSTPEDEGRKVPGETAIPAGRYRVVLTRSSRFGKVLPELLEVRNFSGIRIHAGNGTGDTAGCILVGLGRDGDRVTSSRLALGDVQGRIAEAIGRGEKVWIEVTRASA